MMVRTKCKYTIKYVYYVFHWICAFFGIIKDRNTVRKMHEMERFKIIYAVLAAVTILLVNVCVFNVEQMADVLQ